MVGGMYLLRIDPNRTPNIDEHIRAMEEPIKTAVLEGDCEEINIVANWVLSPNSAIKTIKNVEKIIFNINASF